MAGIGKNSAAASDKPDSIEELKKQFAVSHDKIAKIKNNRKDKNDLTREEQAELRREYLRLQKRFLRGLTTRTKPKNLPHTFLSSPKGRNSTGRQSAVPCQRRRSTTSRGLTTLKSL